MIDRFYAQHTILPKLYESRWQNGWQVFDRTNTEPQSSDPMSIGFFRSRTWAYKVRDALNTVEVANARQI